MPTIILLDVSLSMIRPISGQTEDTRKSLATEGIISLLDYISTHNKLEFTSLVVFSSLWEVVVPFTRDYEELKKGLESLETYDKTQLETAFSGVSTVVLEVWGSSIPCQVILVTDGSPGVGPGSLRQLVQGQSTTASKGPGSLCVPLPFQNNLNILLLANQSELLQRDTYTLYQTLADLNGNGTIYTPDGPLNQKTVQTIFTKVSEKCFSEFLVSLQCGNLKSEVQIHPPLEYGSKGKEAGQPSFWEEFKICGFLDCSDVSSPPITSRHLVLPTTQKGKLNEEEESGESKEEGKMASFCVLLHGSLKVSNMVALVQIGDDWFGILYSWADSKKKSNLMLGIFEPGQDSIPWLGKFNMLKPCSAFEVNPYGVDERNSPFPVKPRDKRSYAHNPVVWIKNNSLQSDVQKILRYARKLPDKMQVFYKELNRIRRAAMSFGMHDLLDGISQMLERECTLLPGTAHPDAALQLTHASKMLRTSIGMEYEFNITALSTNFASGT